MTSLNSKLQLALLNRKKGRNLLEKGFTLVELMIVIVIVGVLSSVALPNFLNQTAKAKATECTTKMTGLLKQVQQDYQLDQDIDKAIGAIVSTTNGAVTATTANSTIALPLQDAISRNSDGGRFLLTVQTPDSADTQLQIKCKSHTSTTLVDYPNASADTGITGLGMFGCIDLATGKSEVSRRLEPTGTTYANSGVVCGGAQAVDISDI